jgi:hypothetical protein
MYGYVIEHEGLYWTCGGWTASINEAEIFSHAEYVTFNKPDKGKWVMVKERLT